MRDWILRTRQPEREAEIGTDRQDFDAGKIFGASGSPSAQMLPGNIDGYVGRR